MRYKRHTGSVAWLIHRITGVFLSLFIFFHFYGLSPRAPFRSEALSGLMWHPFAAIILLAVVVVHGLNGIRLLLMDAGIATRHQKLLFWLAAATGGVIIAFGSLPILGRM